MILGAAGGVGRFATQLARWKGIRVLALVRAGQVHDVRRFDAEPVLDLATVREVDGVLDLIGGTLAIRAWAKVKRGGVMVSTLGPPSEAEASAHDARAVSVITQTNGAQLAELGRLLDHGTLRVDVGPIFPLASAAAAHEALATGSVRGKVVLMLR